MVVKLKKKKKISSAFGCGNAGWKFLERGKGTEEAEPGEDELLRAPGVGIRPGALAPAFSLPPATGWTVESSALECDGSQRDFAVQMRADASQVPPLCILFCHGNPVPCSGA